MRIASTWMPRVRRMSAASRTAASHPPIVTSPTVAPACNCTMGFGMALAALCDVSFSSDKATYNAPEMNHNILPTMVMSSLFDRVSRNAIAYLVYSTDFVDAQRALSYGLVSTVVADDKTLAPQRRTRCSNSGAGRPK